MLVTYRVGCASCTEKGEEAPDDKYLPTFPPLLNLRGQDIFFLIPTVLIDFT